VVETEQEDSDKVVVIVIAPQAHNNCNCYLM